METTTGKQVEWLNQIDERQKGTFWDTLGCQLEWNEAEQRADVLLQASDRHLNPLGIVHGGVTSTLIDNAMGLAVMKEIPGQFAVTTNLNVHFLAPLQKGLVKAEAKVLHRSRSTFTVEARVYGGDGSLGSIGTGSFRVMG